MTNHGTASDLIIDGAYVEFQLAVLRALPRDINSNIADEWRNNGRELAKVLREALLPPDERMRDFFRETNELSISIPALPQPTLEELQSKYDFIAWIERDSSPTDVVTLKLVTVLRENERSISGEHYEQRVEGKPGVILGYQQGAWLVEHQDEFPDFMALLGEIYIDFSGLVVVDADGDRGVPCLDQDDGRWFLYWHWFDYEFDGRGRVASSHK